MSSSPSSVAGNGRRGSDGRTLAHPRPISGAASTALASSVSLASLASSSSPFGPSYDALASGGGGLTSDGIDDQNRASSSYRRHSRPSSALGGGFADVDSDRGAGIDDDNDNEVGFGFGFGFGFDSRSDGASSLAPPSSSAIADSSSQTERRPNGDDDGSDDVDMLSGR
jgi:hypothetical protein